MNDNMMYVIIVAVLCAPSIIRAIRGKKDAE